MPIPEEVASTSPATSSTPRIALPLLSSSRPRLSAQPQLAWAFCAAIGLLLILSGSAFGQAATTPKGKGEATPLSTTVTDAASGQSTTSSDDGSSGGIVRTIVGLAIVIAVIYGVTWVLKQVKKKDEDESFGAGLSSEATLPLGPGRSVHLVRAGNEYLLLGVTDGGVQPLRTYTEQEARDAGFPIDDGIDDLSPLKDRQLGSGNTSLIERVRDMTVRR